MNKTSDVLAIAGTTLLFLFLLLASVSISETSKQNAIVECSKTSNAALCLIALK